MSANAKSRPRTRTRLTAPLPVSDRHAKLKPGDFSAVLDVVPADCVLIGGQAVAWWEQRYGIRVKVGSAEQEVTSGDIDFWGTREDLFSMAASLGKIPALPHRREMTLLVGAVELRIGGTKTALEVLHSVPGLDSTNPRAVAVAEPLQSAPAQRELLVLSPVSMVLAKLHALRHFPQEERQDLVHLRVSLRASRRFIAEVLQQDVRLALWNCNRLIEAHRQKPNRKLEGTFGFRILSGVPLRAIHRQVANPRLKNAEKLKRFLDMQWPRVEGKPRGYVET